jgi:hypothetical protein
MKIKGFGAMGTFAKLFPEPKPDQQIDPSACSKGSSPMKSQRRVVVASVVASTIALAGCHSTDATGPSSGSTLDLGR